MESVKKLTDRLLSNSRMDLEFFMYMPEGTWMSRDHSTVSLHLNPVIYLRYKPPKNISAEYDYSKAAYKITPKNLYQVIKFFNTTVVWLFGDKYKDLFLYNEEGRLIFNSDYSKLHETMPISDYSQQYMQAIPSVVEIGNQLYEGINLFVNKTNYCIPLTYEEVALLFNILKDFRFTQEVSMLLAAYRYIEEHNAFVENIPGKIKTPFD